MNKLLDKLLLHETYDQVKTWILKHKLISVTVAVAVIGLAGWSIWSVSSNLGPAIYTLATVEKGTIMSTVTGTGQVSSTHQIDLTPKASGKVTAVKVKTGQSVKAGVLLVQLDSRDAYKAVRDAQADLTSAQLSLKKTQSSISQSIAQAEDTLTQAQQNAAQSQDSLTKTYSDALANVDTAYRNLPVLLDTLETVLFGQTYSSSQNNIDYYYDVLQRCRPMDGLADSYRNTANSSYQLAQTAYNNASAKYNGITNSSDSAAIVGSVSDAYTTVKTLLDALKTTSDYLNYVDSQTRDYNGITPVGLTTHRTNIATALSTTNSYLASLATSKSNIQSSQNAVTNSASALNLKTDSLQQTKTTNAELDLATAQLNVTQRHNALNDALETLADYSVKAPFDGIIAKVNVQVADSASGGTAVATIITKQSLVEISLNEVDVAKVALGNKTTLTFDAIDDLNISGSVASIDYVGMVEQGVVSYSVTIALDVQDDRVKPGMNANATVITETKQDILVVPTSAIKTQGDVSYVEVLSQVYSTDEAAVGVTSETAPTKKTVAIGISDEDNSEIISGLSEGDQIVIKTTTASASAKKATAPTATSLFGGNTDTKRTTTGGGSMMGGPMP